jgi:pilus assembly protein Flp/PilA
VLIKGAETSACYCLRYFRNEREYNMTNLSDLCRSAYAWFKIESEQGVTAIEYGLIAALIAVAIITAVTLVGTNLTNTFNNVASKLPAT